MSDGKREELPCFNFKNLPIMGEMKLKLDSAKPAKIGEGTYGTWNLWFGYVENANVTWGRGKDAKDESGYTGKVLFFPSETLNENLISAANGNTGAEVLIRKEVEEGRKGLIKRYIVEKLSEGEIPQASLTPNEIRLLNDTQELKTNMDVSESTFINISKEEVYGGQITEERAKSLYKFLE